MNVKGVAIPEEIEIAITDWIKKHKAPNGFRASDLTSFIESFKIDKLNGEIAYRAADRFIQKHRRSREIGLSGANNWCWRNS